MEDYKEDIRQTRKGCLGSSDGKILAQIASLGYVPKSAYKRLAVVKGLIPQEDIPETEAVRFGNTTEMQVYDYLYALDNRWESNKLIVSKNYSREKCKLITHVDFFLQDDETKTVYISECKATKFSIEQTRATYAEQMFIHFTLAKEYAKSLGRGWNVKMTLCHYSTEGLDLGEDNELDPDRLTIRSVRPSYSVFDIEKGMDIVNDFLETFNEYYNDEIDSAYLPENAKAAIEAVATMILEIKEREKKIDEFKRRLYDFMYEKGIKNVKSEFYTISRVDETESKSFDYKRYLEDLRIKHPRKANKITEEYTKTTKRRGYATFKVNERENEEQ